MEVLSDKKRVRDDSDESGLDSPEVKKLREDLLGNLDESDLCTASSDLDSFMRTFEEEISASPVEAPAPVSGESQPELGYLLEASDDELGLPPSISTLSEVGNEEVTEFAPVSSESSAEFSELWRLDDQFSSYDSFDFGLVGVEGNYNVGTHGEYDPPDAFFDFSDVGMGSDDALISLWRSESTPAL